MSRWDRYYSAGGSRPSDEEEDHRRPRSPPPRESDDSESESEASARAIASPWFDAPDQPWLGRMRVIYANQDQIDGPYSEIEFQLDDGTPPFTRIVSDEALIEISLSGEIPRFEVEDPEILMQAIHEHRRSLRASQSGDGPPDKRPRLQQAIDTGAGPSGVSLVGLGASGHAPQLLLSDTNPPVKKSSAPRLEMPTVGKY